MMAVDAPTILLVDDEADILQVIRAYLEKNHYRVYEAETGTGALQLFDELKPDLVVLDLMLPDISGEEICRIIRRDANTPILMLTAKSSEDDMVNGLLMGADDYITKPFSPRELLARVISLLRRAQHAQNQEPKGSLSFGGGRLWMDSERHEVKLEGELLALTPLEFKLLECLSRNPKRAFSRYELVNLIQGDDFDGFERTIDVHIKNLRQKIGDSPRHPQFIGTVFGIGYKFLVNRDE
ncbi:response regulator transcription factor [Paenibacillus sp. HW567]|uniref:response regulator transcription factor n=1 Tax=Paenibacillus sp. HW567 TaxID=1034769 RepID=UPI00037EADEE|nr:response regulator transcription factor [Paenibacillus sp. HW567]